MNVLEFNEVSSISDIQRYIQDRTGFSESATLSEFKTREYYKATITISPVYDFAQVVSIILKGSLSNEITRDLLIERPGIKHKETEAVKPDKVITTFSNLLHIKKFKRTL